MRRYTDFSNGLYKSFMIRSVPWLGRIQRSDSWGVTLSELWISPKKIHRKMVVSWDVDGGLYRIFMGYILSGNLLEFANLKMAIEIVVSFPSENGDLP